MIVPVILCGGSGTRLWPLSRTALPKQFLPLAGDGSLLQDTVQRLGGLEPEPAAPLVICNEAHRFLVTGQLAELGVPGRLLLEPVGRNTAPAVTLAALEARDEWGDDALLLVLAADHVVRDPAAFVAAVEAAVPAARTGSLVTFGVRPTRPETGYGYIEAGPAPAASALAPRPIRRFVEKPDAATAAGYVAAGNYLWNSGMFLFKAGAWLAELAARAPDIHAAVTAVARSRGADGAVAVDAAAFGRCRKESIDYAVMEHTDRGVVVPLDAGWDDVGSYAALRDVSPQDGHGNALRGDVLAIDSRDCYVRADSRFVGVVGLDGCVVVETKDAVLVAPVDRAQEVKRLVEELDVRGRPETRLGREVFRPWGSYDSIDSGTGFQVKRLTVLPGASLSLQLHRRRAEHWVVVAGTPRITRDDEVYDLAPGQHTYIPLGARHRIENPGATTVQIIEVQVGDYLGEDDIVRFEDRYGRAGRTD
jgi:mannose-1-phosphate guanylyltransferase/mannose-6-phosphate isomerase